MRTLIVYELKKILNRKLVWICILISILFVLITVGSPLLGDYYVDGEYINSNYEMFRTDATYQKELSGRMIDDVLLQEMQEAYAKVPMDIEQYTLTEEYQTYARRYSAIYNYVRQMTGMTDVEVLTELANAEDLHTKRMEYQENRWDSFLLSETEKEFWREKETQIETPIIFYYTEAYYVLFSAAYTIGLLSIFVVSVCLASAFPEEHVKRTDQLILSSKCGRTHIYWAKFVAGLLVSFLLALIFILVTFVSAFAFYGTEGFHAAFQLLYPGSSCPISVGQAVVILYLIILVATIFVGALVMMLSEILHNSIGTLAIVIGMIILTMMVSIPEEYRVLNQLWSFLPSNIVAGWSTFSPYTVMILGNVFQAWQVVPVLYSILGIAAAFVTKQVFIKYQVNGR